MKMFKCTTLLSSEVPWLSDSSSLSVSEALHFFYFMFFFFYFHYFIFLSEISFQYWFWNYVTMGHDLKRYIDNVQSYKSYLQKLSQFLFTLKWRDKNILPEENVIYQQSVFNCRACAPLSSIIFWHRWVSISNFTFT